MLLPRTIGLVVKLSFCMELINISITRSLFQILTRLQVTWLRIWILRLFWNFQWLIWKSKLLFAHLTQAVSRNRSNAVLSFAAWSVNKCFGETLSWPPWSRSWRGLKRRKPVQLTMGHYVQSYHHVIPINSKFNPEVNSFLKMCAIAKKGRLVLENSEYS